MIHYQAVGREMRGDRSIAAIVSLDEDARRK